MNIDPNNLHHAYLLVGDPDQVFDIALGFIEKELGFKTRGNPDFWMSEHDTFGIDDARILSELSLRKPVTGQMKIYLVKSSSATVEAQNALLKLFEEPLSGNHFFFIAPEAERVLPTLRSRMMSVSGLSKGTDKSFGKEFLSSTVAQRISLVSDILENKDKGEAKKLIHSIIEALRDDMADERNLVRLAPVLEDLIKTDNYLSDRSPSVKMLLELLATSAPKLS